MLTVTFDAGVRVLFREMRVGTTFFMDGKVCIKLSAAYFQDITDPASRSRIEETVNVTLALATVAR